MATKKSTTRKAPAKKKSTVTRKAPARKAKASGLRAHVGLRREETPFMTFRVTKQTVYWAVLGAVVLIFSMWLLQLQMDIQAIYDEIEANAVITE